MTARFTAYAVPVTRGTGVFVFLLGLTVMVGWHMRVPVLIQILPTFAPMQFNAALGFAFCGLGLVCASFRWGVPVFIFAFLSFLLGTATLAEYLSGTNFGLDTVFVDPYIVTKTSHPGRMAPNSALGFMIAGTALGFFRLLRHSHIRKTVQLVAGSIVFLLGFIALAGYMLNLETAYGWVNLSRMAVHTALGFVATGAGILASSRFWNIREWDNYNRYWISGVVAALLLFLSIAFWEKTARQEIDLIRLSTREETHSIRDYFGKAIQSKILALQRMQERWNHRSGDILEDEWRKDAENYVKDLHGLKSVSWVDRDFDIRWTVNASGYEFSKEKAFATSEYIMSHLLLVRDHRLFRIVKSGDWKPGKREYLFLYPVYRNWKFNGLLVGAINFSELIETVLPVSASRSYGMMYQVDGDVLYSNGVASPAHLERWGSNLQFSQRGINWTITLWPKTEFIQKARSSLPEVALLSGILITIFLTLSLNYAQRSFQLAREFRNKEAHVRVILDNSVEGIITIDENGIIESFNKACERIFGYKIDEVLGRNIKMLMPDPYKCEHDQYIRNYYQTGRPKIIGIGREVEGLTKTGMIFPMDLSVAEIVINGRRYFNGIVRDISERKKFESDRDRLIEKLARSNTELDEFAYIASHDLKEPLRAIHNHSRFLLEDYQEKLDEEGVKKLNRIQSLTRRMEKLIYDLLYFSRLGREQAAIQETDLNDVLNDVLETMFDTLEEKNAVVEVPEPLPVVRCDTVRVTELYRNLITNAIKYNDSNEKLVEIGCIKDSLNIFYVKDNGIGIDEEFHKDVFRIFKRLNSVKQYGEGTGSGLTFVKKIVESHGGNIWIESARGEGTTFYFTLEGQVDKKNAA